MDKGQCHEAISITSPATESAKTWDGYGTALKPASEHWILARKPTSEDTVAANCLKHGTGALAIDAGRISGPKGDGVWGTSNENCAPTFNASPTKHEFRSVAVETESGKIGRWPANFAISHCGMDGSGFMGCECVGEKKVDGHKGYPDGPKGNGFHGGVGRGPDGSREGVSVPGHADSDGKETVTSWRCAIGCPCGHVWTAEKLEPCPECRCAKVEWLCPVARLDQQAGGNHGGGFPQARSSDKTCGIYGEFSGEELPPGPRDMGSGNASRFFHNSDWTLEITERLANADPAYYRAKAGRSERSAGCDDLPLGGPLGSKRSKPAEGRANSLGNPRRNSHPTVKPIKLCQWLATLLLPPVAYAPRRICVPFAGSGSEMIGALLAGWEEVVGIEKDTEHGYVAIAEKRLAFWSEQMKVHGPDIEAILKAAAKRPPTPPPKEKSENVLTPVPERVEEVGQGELTL